MRDDPIVRGYFVESLIAGIGKIVRLAMGQVDLIHHIEVRHQPNALFMSQAATLPAPISSTFSPSQIPRCMSFPYSIS